MYLEADTLDDLLRKVFTRLLRSKNRPSPSKGANREQIGSLLTIRHPRARFSRTEQRATLLSCLGETLWYLSGSSSLDVIEYYIPHYRKFSKLLDDAVVAEGAYGSHANMVRGIHKLVGQDPMSVFAYMYKAMKNVTRFGRLARFDFLAMLGKLGIAPIEPDAAYLWHNATGPLKGARLLFGGSVDAEISARELDEKLKDLDQHLRVGMQTLEDALCNWQKSPAKFIAFRG